MYNFRDFLEFAENLILDADADDLFDKKRQMMIISSVLFSWIAIESFINSMINDFASLPRDMFELHECAFLLEKKIKFEDSGDNLGNFILDNQKEYRALEDKIFFLIAKFGKKNGNYKGGSLWQKFEEFKDTRNSIMHPRLDEEETINIKNANKYFETAKRIIEFVSMHVWGKSVEI